jgi:transposase
MARFDLTDFERDVIQPLLPQKSRGVKRVDDRRVLNGIFWRLGTGAPWADIPARYGPYTTCVNRFNRWRTAGHWARILQAVSEAYQGDIQMIDSSSIRVHQHAAVVPPFLAGCICRTYAAIFSFMAGVMPPIPMLGRSLL